MSAKKRFQQLLQAYHLNDLETVEALLAAGVDPDTAPADRNGDTLLMLAVRQERREATRLLRAHGASSLIANKAGETARGLAEASSDRDLTALFEVAEPVAAASLRLFQVIGRIGDGLPPAAVIEAMPGADLALRQGGRTPLLALATQGAPGPEVYAALLAAGADAAAADDSGDTALHHLAHHGLTDEVRVVLEAEGASPALHQANALGRTALHVAAARGADRVVTLLLEHGARADLRDAVGKTALELASGRTEQLLLDRPGVSLKGDLELALRARWNLGDLAIYADQLQLEGDLRGELVMLDLAPQPRSSKWRDRRRALLEAWLGRDLARRAHQLVRHGFLPYLHDRGGESFGKRSGQSRLAAELLDSPAGRYLRAFAASGSAERVLAALRRLASQPRPHLVELAIGVPPDTHLRVRDELVDALIAATPSLRSLYLLEGMPFPRFPHPAVRRCIAAGELAGLTVTPPIAVLARDLPVLLEALDTGTDVRELFPDLPARLAELTRAAIVDDEGALTTFGRAILDGGFAQTAAGTWGAPR